MARKGFISGAANKCAKRAYQNAVRSTYDLWPKKKTKKTK